MKGLKIAIGVDPGVNTGIAIWDVETQRYKEIKCVKIHEAMKMVEKEVAAANYRNEVLVRFEDARKRQWLGNAGREKLQGAGSIKRDSKIWQDFLTDLKVPFEMVAPQSIMTKTNADFFKSITGWTKQTNEHSRDAAMIIYQYKNF